MKNRTVLISLHIQAGRPRGFVALASCPPGGLSSAGRATESHSVGHRFDPDRLHQLRFVGGAYRVFGWRPFGATGSTIVAAGAERSKAKGP